MNIQAVWTEQIPSQIPTRDYDSIERLIELLDFLNTQGFHVYLDKDGIYGQQEFCDWIFSKKEISFIEIKRELMLKIEKCRNCNDSERREMLDRLGKMGKEIYAALDFREENPFYTAALEGFYQICRKYLGMEDKEQFKRDMEFCFPRIYFDETVKSSLNTLNRNFDDIREEIVKHLTAINDYCDQFLEMMEKNKGYRGIAAEFQKETGIECSPQGSRKQISKLKRKFRNEDTGAEEEIVCELHTKFKRLHIDKTKQDRIYFSPARKGICSEKSVVVHIGDHL